MCNFHEPNLAMYRHSVGIGFRRVAIQIKLPQTDLAHGRLCSSRQGRQAHPAGTYVPNLGHGDWI